MLFVIERKKLSFKNDHAGWKVRSGPRIVVVLEARYLVESAEHEKVSSGKKVCARFFWSKPWN